ncbi:MAG: 2-hydroxyacid dehydrogenase, partial [Acidimicrobiia bacterium]
TLRWMARVVVTRTPPGRAVQRLGEVAEVWLWEEDRAIPVEVLHRQVVSAQGLYCMLTDPIDRALLDSAPKLRVISQMAVGVDNVDLEACTRRRIPVGHTPDVLTDTVADTAMALLLASVRRLPEGAEHVRSGAWGPWQPDLLLGDDLHGTTLGIVGLGRIGQGIVRRVAGFDMRVLYAGPRRKPEAEAALGVLYRGLPELLAEADHVVLTTPLTDVTRHLIDRDALALMKPTATLVNVARGGLVDHDALAEGLSTGVIARAALDVTEPEPIPAEHPLVGMPNCLIVPHLGSASVRTREAMAALAATNLLAALRGERMPACANPKVYRQP